MTNYENYLKENYKVTKFSKQDIIDEAQEYYNMYVETHDSDSDSEALTFEAHNRLIDELENDVQAIVTGYEIYFQSQIDLANDDVSDIKQEFIDIWVAFIISQSDKYVKGCITKDFVVFLSQSVHIILVQHIIDQLIADVEEFTELEIL